MRERTRRKIRASFVLISVAAKTEWLRIVGDGLPRAEVLSTASHPTFPSHSQHPRHHRAPLPLPPFPPTFLSLALLPPPSSAPPPALGMATRWLTLALAAVVATAALASDAVARTCSYRDACNKRRISVKSGRWFTDSCRITYKVRSDCKLIRSKCRAV